ncbi:hypothetical protein B0H13DRAFT_1850880 [Mycena leptocephala]|nr:hypothetical protein B0H13DRAFT_1850880 [Mycena leptocephala]
MTTPGKRNYCPRICKAIIKPEKKEKKRWHPLCWLKDNSSYALPSDIRCLCEEGKEGCKKARVLGGDLLEYRTGRYCCAQVEFNVDMLDLVADGRERTVEQGEQARVSDGKVELGKINLPESTNGNPGSDQASRSQPEGCSPVDEDACPVVGYDGELNSPEPELEAIAGSYYIDTSDDEHFNNEKGGNSNRIPADHGFASI